MRAGVPRDRRSHAPACGAGVEPALAELVPLERLRPLLARVLGDPRGWRWTRR
jgi:hypothetical protein